MTALPTHYGTYEIPSLIRQLFELEQELQQEDLSLDRAFPCMLIEDDFRYSFTPLDVIPLATTGIDGIHYGFLTDFGLAPDLDQAWIVTVSPMDSDCPVRPIAANLLDWLRAMYTDADALINAFEHGADYREYVRTREPHEPDEEASEIRRRLAERFGIIPITDMGAYLDEMREQRKQAVDRETQDGIGVVSTQRTTDRGAPTTSDRTVRAGDPGDPLNRAGDPAASGANRLLPAALPAIDRDFNWDESRQEIQSFWAQASSDDKHVVLRNAQLYSIFGQPSCLEWFMDRLKRDGLPEYAANLGSSFEYVLEPQSQESHTSVIMWSSESDSSRDEQDD